MDNITFLPHFHYNKDWNPKNVSCHSLHCVTSYPTSIITRIETHLWNFVKRVLHSSYPTSIITRIETFCGKFIPASLRPSYPTSIITRIETYQKSGYGFVTQIFLPHFHYNKDWNIKSSKIRSGIPKASYPTSIITRIETLCERDKPVKFVSASYPTSIITRIETKLPSYINALWHSSYPTSIITRIETY